VDPHTRVAKTPSADVKGAEGARIHVHEVVVEKRKDHGESVAGNVDKVQGMYICKPVGPEDLAESRPSPDHAFIEILGLGWELHPVPATQ